VTGIVQIHLGRRCNLRCQHCYSLSGPEQDVELAPQALFGLLEDVAALGYDVVALSGGEPLIFPHLPDVLSCARSLGLRTAITTNGTLFGHGRLARVSALIDVLAVSIDGPPPLHDRVRGAQGAFARTLRGLRLARELELPFSLIYTLTTESARHLDWVAQFALEEGARLLQLHPLELTGRAAQTMAAAVPGADTCLRALETAAALRRKYRPLQIQVDVLSRGDLVTLPALNWALQPDFEVRSDAAAPALIDILVVEEIGIVVPFSYGIAHRFAIADLSHIRLREAWPEYLRTRYPSLRRFCAQVVRELIDDGPPAIDWYGRLVARSLAPTVPIQQARRGKPIRSGR
jgi:MoaA/NifB/PqqE/SkfB family radical SAM enzyme